MQLIFWSGNSWKTLLDLTSVSRNSFRMILHDSVSWGQLGFMQFCSQIIAIKIWVLVPGIFFHELLNPDPILWIRPSLIAACYQTSSLSVLAVSISHMNKVCLWVEREKMSNKQPLHLQRKSLISVDKLQNQQGRADTSWSADRDSCRQTIF